MFRKLVLVAAISAASLAPTLAAADGYIIGAGRWTCSQAIKTFEAGAPVEKGQLGGWLMGYWSHATLSREKGFIDTVEKVGGLKIANATIEECRKAPPETLIFRVADRMIANTK